MQPSIRSATKIGSFLLLFVAAASCGGGGSDGPTPPAGGGVGGGAKASTMAVSAGDGQTAAPGAALSVSPAVIVRDAAGKPFPGATVTFTVDSGGGTIASPTATTGSDGIATAGKWTLGSGGPQVLAASSGSLSRVKLRATLKAAGSSLAVQTISSAGGTITVNKSGSPLTGLTLTVPSGALASATTITLTDVPTAGLTIPTGMTVVSSSALGIRATQGALKAPVLVRFPVSAKPGQVSMIALRNPATGAVTVLPTVRSDATSITVALSSLDGQGVPSARLAAPSLSLSLASAAEDGEAMMFQVAIDPALLARDFDSGFRPGVDDWDFARNPVASLSFLKGGGEAQTAVDPGDGMVATEIWYYVNQKASAGALNRKFQLQGGVPESNRDGIRWSAIATKDVPDLFTTGGVATQWKEQITLDAAGFAKAQFTGIKVMFLLGFERPVPVLLFVSEDDAAPRIGVAYRVTGNSIDIAVPDKPGASYRATYTDDGMTAFDVVGVNDVTYRVRAVAGLHYSMVVKDATLSSQWGRVSAGTIGNSEGWPTVELHYEDAKLDTAKVFLADTLRHWWECPGCPEYGYRPSAVPASASHVQKFRFGKFEDAGFGGLGDSFGVANFAPNIVPEATDTQKVGFAIYLPGPGSAGPSAASPGWLGWNTVTYKRLRLQPEPAEVALGSGDTTVTFKVKPKTAPPTGTRYAWVLRTETGRDSVETADATHMRELKGGTDGVLLITALEPGKRRVIGRDSVVISADSAAPYWQITSIVDQDDMFEDTEASGETADLLRRLIASPRSAMLAVEKKDDGVRELNLKVLRSGVWTAADCCPPVATGPLMIMNLGTSPATSLSVGPFFSEWKSSNWTETTSDLASGGMEARDVFGLVQYRVKDAGTQTGPAGAVRLIGTRNDKTMTGVIGIYIWPLNDDDEIDSGPELYQLRFTATRMK